MQDPTQLQTHVEPLNDDGTELQEEEEGRGGVGEEEEDYDDEDDEVEKLEEQVHEMAQQILNYRNTLPDQLKTTLASLLVAQRPNLPASDPPTYQTGPSSIPDNNDNPDLVRPSGSANEAFLPDEDSENAKKLELLKQKILSNASAIPVVLKRMKECMTRMDKLQSYNGDIHPAFKRKRHS